ncbi:MAG: sigma-54-dependent Fis family transcriptional regulator [Deltaproteobacteria bacterium]|nr:sigma-54-dependent Fis family transcriptional regulator [Deltaproteobacteria bacterium]
MNVLILDDQRSARRVLADLLGAREEVVVHEAASLAEARRLLDEHGVDLAFIDLRLSDDPRDREGLSFLTELKSRSGAHAVMVTGYGEMAEVRAAMRAGAHDYVLKDELCEEIVLPIVDELRDRRRLEAEVVQLRAQANPRHNVPGLVGASGAMERLRESIRRVAASDRPVLVAGPSGSGKELVVHAIHALGRDPSAPLLDLNCGAIPEALIEAQLFGHERGAFTGADRKSAGYFQAVGVGTLFLDEIAELPLGLQAKLLRVIESRSFRAVGSTVALRFEGRVIAATHADLVERVRHGRFREDLFHRLNVLGVRVPGLDERTDDIPALVEHFAREQPRTLRFTSEAIDLLRASPWSGHARELRNVVDRLAVFFDADPVGVEQVQDALSHAAPARRSVLQDAARAVLALSDHGDKLTAMEAALVEEALAMTDGNKTAAARLLGVHRKVIERRAGRESERPDGEEP